MKLFGFLFFFAIDMKYCKNKSNTMCVQDYKLKKYKYNVQIHVHLIAKSYCISVRVTGNRPVCSKSLIGYDDRVKVRMAVKFEIR